MLYIMPLDGHLQVGLVNDGYHARPISQACDCSDCKAAGREAFPVVGRPRRGARRNAGRTSVILSSCAFSREPSYSWQSSALSLSLLMFFSSSPASTLPRRLLSFSLLTKSIFVQTLKKLNHFLCPLDRKASGVAPYQAYSYFNQLCHRLQST